MKELEWLRGLTLCVRPWFYKTTLYDEYYCYLHQILRENLFVVGVLEVLSIATKYKNTDIVNLRSFPIGLIRILSKIASTMRNIMKCLCWLFPSSTMIAIHKQIAFILKELLSDVRIGNTARLCMAMSKKPFSSFRWYNHIPFPVPLFVVSHLLSLVLLCRSQRP